jgi:phospholipid/cholesterol/gamma-HCH transport system permease protein
MILSSDQKTDYCETDFDRLENGELLIRLGGDWSAGNYLPQVTAFQREVAPSPGKIGKVAFDTRLLTNWDSRLPAFLIKVIELCAQSEIQVDREGLPAGVTRLLDLAAAVPERKGSRRESARVPILDRIGGSAVNYWRSTLELLIFIGEIAQSFMRMITGRARFHRSDLLLIIQESSIEALPIVSLISLLVGLILAFVGAIQLKYFGAQIYVADLVGIGMVRAMGAIMTGIIMAGRTGASFAARIGTMQVNEEIDALQTTGISPIDFLVLPRLLAMALIMPLLTLYADFMGILGGLIVGVIGLDLNMIEYYNKTTEAVSLTNVWIGVFSGFVFGIIVALAGCLRGMQCGRSASAVGDATTSAVVTGIVSIVVATAIITISCNILGI